MEIGPIFRALMRNKLGVALISIQIAVTMTVMTNAIFIIQEREELMTRPSGLDEPNMFWISSMGFGDSFNEQVVVADDLDRMRRTPGIENASLINAIPVSGSGSSTGVRLEPDDTTPSVGVPIYYADDQVINTLGANLIAGQAFTPQDMRYRSESGRTSATTAIITRALAEQLYEDLPLDNVLGQTIYLPGAAPLQIKGVVERLQGPWPTSEIIERSIVLPEQFLDGFSTYIIRTAPGERDRLMVEVEEMLVASNDQRVILGARSMAETRDATFRADSALSTVLWMIIYILVAITGLGIVGLAVFGINRRRKQIGTRRALGASRFEILRYFMVENLLITSVGVLLGAVLTIGLSMAISSLFNMPAITWYYTPVGMLVLLLLGQLAVFGPSRGAARIEPAIATRSV
ncbi:MAG: FtsX-like permease family protein [Gammaproteobacteria bacterium]